MWEEMGKTFADPRLGDYMTSEEIAQAKLDFEKKFQKICPKGMYFPVIEYECDEDISLMFYSKSYLDAKPLHSNSGMAFILRPDQPTGISGLKLKAAVIQEPVPADTNIIEAELFQYTRTLPCGDIKLD